MHNWICPRSAQFVCSVVVLIVATVAVVSSAAAKPQFDLTKRQRLGLSSGGVLVEVAVTNSGSGGVIRAVVDVPVKPEFLWGILTDCRRAPQFLKRLESCRILKQGGNGLWDLREHRVRLNWLFPQLRCVIRSEYVAYQTIRFERASGDLRALSGVWRFQRISEGTRLFYEVDVETGFPLPRQWVRSMLVSDVENTLQAVRKEALRRRGGVQRQR